MGVGVWDEGGRCESEECWVRVGAKVVCGKERKVKRVGKKRSKSCVWVEKSKEAGLGKERSRGCVWGCGCLGGRERRKVKKVGQGWKLRLCGRE